MADENTAFIETPEQLAESVKATIEQADPDDIVYVTVRSMRTLCDAVLARKTVQ